MGAPELWRILVSLVGSGLALGAVLVVVRLLRVDLARLPKQWIPPAATFFMMLTSVALLLTLIQRGPRHAEAIDVEPEPGVLAASSWKFRVYPLENWGELARRMALGEELTRNMLDELDALGADARRGADNDYPVGLYDDGRRPSQQMITHFSALAPFMCISGHVSRNKDGRYEARIELHEIDHSVHSKRLWQKTLTFRGTNESSREVAREAIGAIAALAQEATEARRARSR